MKSIASPTRRTLLKIAAGLPLAPALLQPAQAWARSPGPVSLMVPYPAGGSSDVSARILSKPIGDALGAQVIVDNLGGATGTIAAAKVLNTRADGSMFFQGTQNELILPPLTNKAVIQDLAGGQIDFSIMPFQASMLEMVRTGRFRALAVLSAIPSITQVPALRDFAYASLAGYFVKRGTPQDVKQRLNQAIGQALQDPQVIPTAATSSSPWAWSRPRRPMRRRSPSTAQ